MATSIGECFSSIAKNKLFFILRASVSIFMQIPRTTFHPLF